MPSIKGSGRTPPLEEIIGSGEGSTQPVYAGVIKGGSRIPPVTEGIFDYLPSPLSAGEEVPYGEIINVFSFVTYN